IGLAFALPLAWFAWKRAIPKGYGWGLVAFLLLGGARGGPGVGMLWGGSAGRLVSLLLLGGAQGALGWYMVVSGLSERTDVSHFRLSAHLLLALFLFAALIWAALDFRRLAVAGEKPARLTPPAAATFATLFVQLLLGAWVAGLNAGYVASDWPLMQGKFFPDGVDWSRGALYALTDDPYTLPSPDRWWARVVLAAVVIFARKVKPIDRKASIAIHAAFGTQILLGIAT